MTKHKNNYEMSAVADAAVGPTVTEDIKFGAQVIKLVRPQSPERLLDSAEVAAAYVQDEYMPYWATLWPVSRYLASEVLGHQWPAGLRAIELGCGLGLPGLAALKSGMQVTFTDYDATALQFVHRNAALNGFPEVRTELVDWRTPLEETFEVILASDLTYESRNVVPLVASFAAMLAPGGVVLVADQNRAHSEAFRQELTANGFVFTTRAIPTNPAVGNQVPGTVYLVRRANPSAIK